MIVGGFVSPTERSNDVLLFDVNQASLTKLPVTTEFKFECRSTPAIIDVGKAVALVRDSSGIFKVIKITQRDSQISFNTLHTIGHWKN